MPRSSFSDNPLLRVSRPVSACSRCRTAKVKCDGKLPACTACEKAGRESECSAANDQFARGKERSYVAALELRVEKLERRLAYAKSRKASVALHEQDAAPDTAFDRKDSLAMIRAAIHRNAARKRENSDINSLISDFGYLSVNATTRDFEPTSTNMTFARLVLAASVNTSLPDIEETDRLELPPRQSAYGIVQYYLSNIYTLYPSFSETALLSLLNDLYLDEPTPMRSSDAWLLWMVLAIGSMAQSQRKGDEFYQNGVQFVARAIVYADRALMPGYVTQVQSLLLLTQYSMLDPAHFDTWILIGFTSRAMIDLGFHQDAAPRTSATDKAAQESRRRLFYCVYSLDRDISMVHARAFSFTNEAASVALPSPSNPSRNLPSNGQIAGPVSIDAALSLFQLRQKQSHWYQTMVQSDPSIPLPDPTSFIWQMCNGMAAWSNSLPSSLPVGIREMFDLELRYSYVYCIAPSARAPAMTSYGRQLIFEHVIAYVDRIYEVAHATVNTAFYTYYDALRVYFMGSQFMAVLRDAGDVLLAANANGNVNGPPGMQIPLPMFEPGKPRPPPLPERFDRATMRDNLDRSLRCLERVGLTLKKWGERWENAVALWGSWDIISEDTRNNLKMRKEMKDAALIAQGQQGMPPVSQQQQQQQPTQAQVQQMHPMQNGHMGPGQRMHSPPQGMQVLAHQMGPPPAMVVPMAQQQAMSQQHQQRQQQQEVRWVDMDVSGMIQRGGQI